MVAAVSDAEFPGKRDGSRVKIKRSLSHPQAVNRQLLKYTGTAKKTRINFYLFARL